MHHSVAALLLGFFVLAPFQAAVPTRPNSSGVTVEKLRSLLEHARAQNDVPALAAGFIDGRDGPLVAVVGVRKRGTDTPATENDQWHIGSNTKPITAFLIAVLVEHGLLDWDTPLEQIFREHAGNWDPDLKKITLAHLLTHTSGLPATGPLANFLMTVSKRSAVEDRAMVVRNMDTVKLMAKPGEKYLYSNLGYVLLGAIVDRRGKASWEEQLGKKVFQPLGIKHWGLGPWTKEEALLHPWPHKPDSKPMPADGVMDNPQVLNSAGRIHLSVADYNRFLAETLRLARGKKGLLKPATAQKMLSNPYPVSPHCLGGWAGFRKEPAAQGLVLVHNGSNTFNYCTAVVVPDQGLAFCILTNQGGPGGPGEKACQQVSKELGNRDK